LLQSNVGPEWEMKQDEALGIAKASANVLRHYDIQATQKAIDFAALASVLAQSYGVRLAATAIRKRAAPPRPAPNGQAVPIVRNERPVDLTGALADPIGDPVVH
jgi:hypothetical protein